MASSRRIKEEVLSILAKGGEVDKSLAAYREEELIHPLFSTLCRADETVRLRAALSFGRVVARLAARDMEAARVVMRRLLWSLNDESGGIGWGAPEAMAATMAESHALADEYLHMLVSYLKEDGDEPCQDGNFLELPALQRGLLWGIGHVAPLYRNRLLTMGVPQELEKYLSSPDKIVAALSLWCFARLAVTAPAALLQPLL
ncbi:MAG: hypothetical protein LBH14_08865, partial [Desulfobulbaceae bacterium]|nr:hypothetical protein [Desulfobulbaceae bacterium]